MRKTFIMVAAPGMIGKSTAVKKACASIKVTSILENDCLMHDLFALVRLPEPKKIPINEVDEWRKKVDVNADCNRLIRLQHRDWVARHWQNSLLLAEGYTYMMRWYRDEAIKGLNHLGYEFNYWLLKYNPLISEQVERRVSKYADWKWESQSEAFHKARILEQWDHFESPATTENLHFREVNADQLREIVEYLAQEGL